MYYGFQKYDDPLPNTQAVALIILFYALVCHFLNTLGNHWSSGKALNVDLQILKGELYRHLEI